MRWCEVRRSAKDSVNEELEKIYCKKRKGTAQEESRLPGPSLFGRHALCAL